MVRGGRPRNRGNEGAGRNTSKMANSIQENVASTFEGSRNPSYGLHRIVRSYVVTNSRVSFHRLFAILLNTRGPPAVKVQKIGRRLDALLRRHFSGDRALDSSKVRKSRIVHLAQEEPRFSGIPAIRHTVKHLKGQADVAARIQLLVGHDELGGPGATGK